MVIAASTGGPRALTELIPALPGDLPAPVLVVQHMPARFTQLMAQRLDRLSALHVREGTAGDVVDPGYVYIAPGGRHLTLVRADGRVTLAFNDTDPVRGVRPAADILFTAAAAAYGCGAMGIVLTGMGEDGANGLRAIRAAGGWTAAQDPAGAVLGGMPRAAAPHAQVLLPLDALAAAVVAQAQRLAALADG